MVMVNRRIDKEVLSSFEPESGSYVSLCFDTMKILSEQWYFVADTESDDEVVLERNYIISLVFLMGKNSNGDTFGTNVFPSGENNKFIYDNLQEIKETYNNLYSKELKGRFEVIPDMVIHTSHNPQSKKSVGQYVAIEAKTTKQLGKVAFYRDLFKLNVYLCSLLYKHVVYLIVNTEKDKIEKMINQYFSENFFYQKDQLDKIYFFIQKDKNSSPTAYKLSDTFISSLKGNI